MCSTLQETPAACRMQQLGEHCATKVCSTRACGRLAEEGFEGKLAAPAPAVDLPMPITDAFVGEILKPYKPHARYLKSAEITHFRDKVQAGASDGLVVAEGRFSIPESCYIDDTGHFNAVEFNICFNQLAYVMFGKCIADGILGKLRCEQVNVPSFADFKLHQLPSMLIVSIESRYYKQLNSRDFTAELTLNKISPVGSAWFFSTSITFSDADGVKAKGTVMLAFSPTFTPVKH
jgi:FcoT-like thioesterase domain